MVRVCSFERKYKLRVWKTFVSWIYVLAARCYICSFSLIVRYTTLRKYVVFTHYITYIGSMQFSSTKISSIIKVYPIDLMTKVRRIIKSK